MGIECTIPKTVPRGRPSRARLQERARMAAAEQRQRQEEGSGEEGEEEGEEGEEGEQLGERGSVTSFGEEDSGGSGSDKGSEDGRPPRSERQESIEV